MQASLIVFRKIYEKALPILCMRYNFSYSSLWKNISIFSTYHIAAPLREPGSNLDCVFGSARNRIFGGSWTVRISF